MYVWMREKESVCVCDEMSISLSFCKLSCFLPSTGHKNNPAQPKPDRGLSATSHCSLFKRCLSVIL